MSIYRGMVNLYIAVKPVLNGHSEEDKRKDYHLMYVKIIAKWGEHYAIL